MYSLLHCHFESALRALAVVKPDRVQHVRATYSSPSYRRAAPAARLTLLWRNMLALSENEITFDESTFRRVVQDLINDMRSSSIDHIDLRIGSSTGRWKWMRTAADGLSIFRDELSRCGNLSMSFLAGVNLTKPREELDALFDALLGNTDLTESIAGLDINLLPAELPKFNRYIHALRLLQLGGLKLNIHLGELFDNEISRYILSCITPDRIGHGVLLLRDKSLVEIIRSCGICLDMCPTSNTLLGVVNWNRENPAKRALRLGIPVSINTDDPVLFNTDIDQEFRMARLTDQEHAAVIAYSRKCRYGAS